MKSERHRVLKWLCLLLVSFAGFQLYVRSMLLLPQNGIESANLSSRSCSSKQEALKSIVPPSNSDLPLPVILISLGRSGSDATWQIMGNLTGTETQKQLEYTGSNTDQNEKFFKTHTGKKWLVDLIWDRMKEFPSAGVVGMKWKLVPQLFDYSGVKDAVDFIATSRHPPIKVVRSRRNLLDVQISRYKHEHTKMQPHCQMGQNCLNKLLKASSGLELPTKYLVQTLRSRTKEEDEVDEFLVKMAVSHVSVSYDKLYSGDDTAVDEWKRLFAYLGRGPVDDLTMEQLHSAMKLQVTHYPWHNKTLANYEEVRNVLLGTEFEGLLH
jgi:hypothetical protein